MIDFEDDRYIDVLQNIEFSVVEVYRSEPELLDSEVERALRAVVVALNAGQKGKEFDLDAAKLTPRGRKVFDAVCKTCQWRMGPGVSDGSTFGPAPRTSEELVACLQRVRKSVRRWTKEKGKKGYLEFVKDYVP